MFKNCLLHISQSVVGYYILLNMCFAGERTKCVARSCQKFPLSYAVLVNFLGFCFLIVNERNLSSLAEKLMCVIFTPFRLKTFPTHKNVEILFHFIYMYKDVHVGIYPLMPI